MRPCEVCGASAFRSIGEKDAHRFERCQACHLERIEPQPTDETLARIYGEHYYDGWGLQTDEQAVEHIKRSTFQRVLRGLGDARGRLLDCGAATGFLMGVARDLGFDVYGVELSEFGAGKIAERFGQAHAFQGNLEDAPFEKGSFQVVTMCDFLEHVRDPEAVLRRANELLAPGGKLALTLPHVGSLSQRTMGMRWPNYKTEHLYYFGKRNLEQLLSRMGFTSYRAHTQLKTMNVRYMAHIFDQFPHWFFTPTMRAAQAVMPGRLVRASFPIMTGDMVAYAQKP
jgi:2-polyprenyl-3-methyl-5-hydroxy-6-metoxy-1,4-benzoquinol methylase